jgi:protein TonB
MHDGQTSFLVLNSCIESIDHSTALRQSARSSSSPCTGPGNVRGLGVTLTAFLEGPFQGFLMAKPLRSEDPSPQNMQFTHFGVLNDGSQSKSSLFTSISVNLLIALVILLVSAAAKKTIDYNRQRVTELVEPIPIKKPEPIRPRIIPKPLPTPPVVKAQPPKIKVPEVKLPDVPKPVEVKMTQPVPIVKPAPPKLVQAPPAPRMVNLGQAKPASVVNNSPQPSAVALGHPDNPIAPSNRPATATVNLGNSGMAGMPASNTGRGPASAVVNLGSGSTGSQNMSGRDNAAASVRGVKLGVSGGTGPMNSTTRVAGPVNLGQNNPPPMPKPAGLTAVAVKSGPKVLFKPKPEYTAEAKMLHIEGTVSVKLRVSSSGAVQVLGVASDLGHGLGDSAVRAVEGTRFSPATDASGHPIDWEGIVNVAFQLAG